MDTEPDAIVPILTWDLITHILQLNHYPLNRQYNLIHPHVNELIAPTFFEHLDLGIDYVEPVIPLRYLQNTQHVACGGVCHHKLGPISLSSLQLAWDSHGAHKCPYLDDLSYERLVITEVSYPTVTLCHLLDNLSAARLQEIELHVDRLAYYSSPEMTWAGTALSGVKVKFVMPRNARFWPLMEYQETALGDLFAALRTCAKELEIVNASAIEGMRDDDWADWTPDVQEIQRHP